MLGHSDSRSSYRVNKEAGHNRVPFFESRFFRITKNLLEIPLEMNDKVRAQVSLKFMEVIMPSRMTDPRLVRSLIRVADPREKRRGQRWLGVWTACLAHWKMSARTGRMCVS
jgi:hypothetical protein